MNLVKINIEYLRVVNYALFHNGIRVCQEIEVKNESQTPIEDVKVFCIGEFIEPYESDVIGVINPGNAVKINQFNIVPDSAHLITMTERVVTKICIYVKSGQKIVGEEYYVLEFVPYDYWPGSKILPQSIVSFITPNIPIIDDLVVKSATILKTLTGSSSFVAYQTGNSNDVRQQVAAVFAALHELGIVYRGLPVNYEAIGQRIALPEQVITYKIGNCIELTLLMATVLEAVGINSLIVLQQEHAFLGVWLVDDCCHYSVCDDPAFIEKNCSRGIDEMLVLECTQVANEKTSFEDAVSIAETSLADYHVFEMFIDVKRSRLEGIRPLPSRIQNNGIWTLVEPGVRHDSCVIEIKEHDRYDLSQLPTVTKELTRFDIWERKLLDFSLRNSLLNLYLRSRAIQFISFNVNRIEDHLQDGKEYCITYKPKIENFEESFDTTKPRLVKSRVYDSLRDLINDGIEHQLLHSYLSESETKRILKNIYREARNAIEETGANSLFLAIGVLRWYQTRQNTMPRFAPLLLLPVEMVYKKGNYYIRTRDEEISLNITLMEFLRQNYNITIKGLDPLPLDDSGVDVPKIFAIIRDALKEQKLWDIEEECVLGTFSFNKFLMWNDIHSHREQICENRIISSLISKRLTWTPHPITSDLKNVDLHFSPVDIALPMSVDSSQMAAVIEGGNGNSFILDGPPGTGKSQTITNLISNALYHGKRVLFVAEKMAALSVVKSRLDKIGIGPFCLELHSNKSTKHHVLQQLEKALNVAHIMPPAEYTVLAEKIFSERKGLIEYMEALHSPSKNDGLSLYDCIEKYESIAEEPLRGFSFDKAIDALILEERFKGIEDLLGSKFEAVIRLVNHPYNHPLNGFIIDRSMLKDLEGVVKRMNMDNDTIRNTIKEIESFKSVKALREKLMRDNSSAILEEDPAMLYQQWRAIKAKWFFPRLLAERAFINKLRQFNRFLSRDEVEVLIENLIEYRDKHEKILELQRILKQYFGCEYCDDELPNPITLESTVEKLTKWAANSSKMRDWLNWSEYCDELKRKGMKCVVDAIESNWENLSAIKNSFLKALLKYKVDEKISHSDILVVFEGLIFDEKIAAYKRMIEEFQLLTKKELYATLASRIPQMTDDVITGSEIGFIKRNISNGGRGVSLRHLFDQLPTLMPRLCPCMLMSPMSVAQYIDLDSNTFDLVIFDEASQMPTSEAVGAIARGKALIVVGDRKQMPPTSFFSTDNVDDEESSINDMESILEECHTLDMPTLQLSWHYRSKHESLIAFSNNEYYDGTLITFPSVDDRHCKVQYIPVQGCYDKGGTRSNKAEAEAIVKELVRRLRDEELRKYSIGVIAFNINQQGLIEDLWQERLDRDKELQDIASQMNEHIFVKNLENVQGDERDVILFSIGYGPDKEGKISMNFGPLNRRGGERRLNVAVSRARYEMLIYSTLKSTDMDISRSRASGVIGLKHFLQYAETKQLPTVHVTNIECHQSDVANQIALELSKLGYAVSKNIGRSKFRVDVAVEGNNNSSDYILAILLDGETYRDTHTTRDREVVQPSVLKNLGWKVMRVWSVDWYNNKERVLSRIVEKLTSDTQDESDECSCNTFDVASAEMVDSTSRGIWYSCYDTDSKEANGMANIDLIRHLLETEQPMTFMYLCRRVNALRNAGRVTPTLQKALKVYEHDFYVDDSGAWWLNIDVSKNYRSYRYNSGRDILEVPEIEVINAIVETLVEQVALRENALTIVASKKLGFTRRGVNVEAAFKQAVEKLKLSNIIEMIGENIRLKEVI